MGNARETNNLFLLYKMGGFKTIKYYFKRRKIRNIIKNKEFWEDNFMPLYCKIFNHTKYQPNERYEPNEWACKKCHRFIKI